ncbi:GNAT family N-acetyltransferase [Solihabitans fulvus]|uniref:GNAT family N-acetyltransferase n=1 Tax=Solihabitans fulvus TaxID=1892852 RepID=A0A5B2WQQ9_9PSEU|nr:GNAT family N-acetyltransferase [Solihabitans fulvus]
MQVRRVAVTDPEAEPLLLGLEEEYTARYGRNNELNRYPPQEFAPPFGALLLLVERGTVVAGGAFRRYDEHTAEFKRIWTAATHRRRGLASRVLVELEREAGARGYRRVYLTTGPRQPEALGLYLSTGYRPLFDLTADPETVGHLPFEKSLAATP